MKKQKIWCILLIALLSLPCFAKKPIILEGFWVNRGKSAIPTLPIQAWVEDDNRTLLLEFSGNLGTILVTITDETGKVVYNEMIRTAQTLPTIISLNEEMKEGYVLSVSNRDNKIVGNI